MLLPPPQGRQREVVYLPADGNSVVLGTGGSGKTLMAIWRAAHLGDPRAPESGATLLVTFNTTLVTYLKHLQPPGMTNITVETYHKFGRGYLAAQGINMDYAIIGGDSRRSLIRQAADQLLATDGRHRALRTVKDENHGSVVKPPSVDHLSYKIVRSVILETRPPLIAKD